MSTKTTPILGPGEQPVSLEVVRPAPPRGRIRQPAAPGRREAQYLRRADALAASGQIDKALVHLRKLVAALPGSTHGYLRIAALLRHENRCAEALEILRAAVAHAPHCLASREALAETCLESGRWEEAVVHSQVLLRLSPHSLFARDVLSAAFLQQGQLDRALRVTGEMIRLDPSDPTNYFKRGVLLQQKGVIGAASLAFSRVLEMDPDPEVADESRAALEMLDGYQIRQILTIAVEDVPFRLWLLRDPGTAVADKGFVLSEAGLAALAQVRFEGLTDAPPGWRQYVYH